MLIKSVSQKSSKQSLPIRRALISVFEKSGVVELAKALAGQGIEIVSTGGTKVALKKAGVKVKDVSELTGSNEILDGRVKTLHPKIHGGLLAAKGNKKHEKEMKKNKILQIDLLVANFYPFEKAMQTKDEATIIENIDIGGPAMVRAAAKNFNSVAVLTSKNDYESFVAELKQTKKISFVTRKNLAAKAFACVANYDVQVANFFKAKEYFFLSAPLVKKLRYGENPHQKAEVYGGGGIVGAKQLGGKELSYNNLNDVNAAYNLVEDFAEPTIAIIKHTNPCGVSSNKNLKKAYQSALNCDKKSAFGGIVATNKTIEKQVAKEIIKIFTEVVIARGYTKEALEILKQKPNLRILKVKKRKKQKEIKSIEGGVLVQESDTIKIQQKTCQVKTKSKPTKQEWQDMLFAMKVVRHVKSNAIVIAKNQTTTGIGAGQTSRIESIKIAIKQNKKRGNVAASEAFFPFKDSIETLARAGIKSIIKPEGSKNDKEVIEAANKKNLKLIKTKTRHFKH